MKEFGGVPLKDICIYTRAVLSVCVSPVCVREREMILIAVEREISCQRRCLAIACVV